MAKQSSSNQLGFFHSSFKGRFGITYGFKLGCLAALVILISRPVQSQDTNRFSLTGQEAIEARRIQAESMPYTIKSGDLKLLVTSSLGLDWNDNIGISEGTPLADFILEPMLKVNASYPVTANNLLTLFVGAGYDQYLDHGEYSGPRILSGSQLSYDIYVKDFWINLHDNANYTQDAAGLAALANTARYDSLDNSIGLSTTWDLRDLVLTLGYDHENFISSNSQFDYMNHAAELISARAGFRFNPRFTAGLEGTISSTAYDQQVLNNNIGYSGGLYADWRPGSNFKVQPRAGYVYYSFQQTSHFIRAVDQNSWYVGIKVAHEVTKALTYSLEAGHELRLGIQADSIEDSYVRPNVTWKFLNDVSLQGSLSYEHGTQGSAQQTGGLAETYDWVGGGIGLSRSITKKLTASLNYRSTVRSSNAASRGYTQDVVGLLLTYTFQ